MQDQIYRETLLEVFRNPQNRGEIADPDLEARLVNPLCGDEVKIQLKLKQTADGLQTTARKIKKAVVSSPNAVVESAAFTGNGCAISQASASLLANYVEGKTVEEIREVKKGDILDLIGINPTPARMGCALLSLEVLKKLLTDYGLQTTANSGGSQ